MNKQELPRVYKAIELLFFDQGCKTPSDTELGELPTHYDAETRLPDEVIDWPKVEAFLATLSNTELVDFCVGDELDQGRIANRSEDGQAASDAITALFCTYF